MFDASLVPVALLAGLVFALPLTLKPLLFSRAGDAAPRSERERVARLETEIDRANRATDTDSGVGSGATRDATDD